VREFQRHTSQFTPGKNFCASGAMGPWLVTPDEWPARSGIVLETRVNGKPVQHGRLDELIFDVPSLIEYLSTFAELQPGDVIATGTPGGVGAARTPPAWLEPGDTVEVDVAGLACLTNTVRAE
jgi:2-keto-4-pentenoate hydratase/2-oxohepta-3-ene-1,7-dioic acid hydratase in catechol pathway